jgi:hypothetical protein
MFSCYDLSGIKITTAVYTDCNPSLDLVMTASEFAALRQSASSQQLDPFLILEHVAQGFLFTFPLFLLVWGFKLILNHLILGKR